MIFNFIKIFALLLMLNPFLLFCQDRYDSINFNFEMAEHTLTLLHLTKSGISSDSLKNYFTEFIVPTEGFKSLIKHFSRFDYWDADTFFNHLMQSFGIHPLETPLYDENGNLNFYGRSKALWLGAFNNIDSVRSIIGYLKSLDLKTLSYIKAKKFLPKNSHININFYFLLSGGSPAFSLGNKNGIDILQLPRLVNGEINLNRLIDIISHEIHHSGLLNYLSDHSPSLLEDNRFNLLGTIVAEGIPTYYINNLPIQLKEVYQTDDPLDKQVLDDWNTHLSNIDALYKNAESDISKSLAGLLTDKELYESWLSGAQGAAYVLGADMFSTIDKIFGVNAAIEIIIDIRKFLSLYNEAVRMLREENKYLFNTELVEKIKHIDFN